MCQHASSGHASVPHASAPLLLPPDAFAAAHFGAADLGDVRRTKRLVTFAARMAAEPAAGIPKIAGGFHQAKAAYRLLGRSDLVTFDAIARPHHDLTRAALASHNVVLLAADVTQVNYTHHTKTRGLEMIGDGHGRGFSLHSTLAMTPDGTVLGLARQEVFYRQEVGSKTEKRAKRMRRERQSMVWARSVREGPTPTRPGQRYAYLCDAEADDFSFFDACRAARCDFLIHAAQDRRAALGHDAEAEQTGLLRGLMSGVPACGVVTRRLRAHKRSQVDRDATLSVAWSAVTVFVPWTAGRGGAHGADAAPLRLWAVRAWEATPPPDVEEPVDWLLLTTLPVTDFASASGMTGLYAFRWPIEEFHHCFKTGCATEQRQLEHADRLEALAAVASVVAVRLLALKQQVKQKPQARAVEHVDELDVAMLCAARKLKWLPRELSLHEFWRQVAMLGGFLGRRRDGEPGWRTLWLGWRELQLFVAGAKLAADRLKRSG